MVNKRGENTSQNQDLEVGSLQIGDGKALKIIDSSPCTKGCPLNTNVKAYVSLIAAGKFSEALEVVRQTNPFPGICGRVCFHPCEEECRRNDIDEPVSIATLKRFIADYELRCGIIPKYEKIDTNAGNIAIVGSGPAGLTCATDLTRKGYNVTVYEKLPVAGGMLAVGIPEYRLPKDILHVEINAIKALGVDIKLNTKIGDTLKIEDLEKQYDAIFIAPGAQLPARLGIEDEEKVKEGIVSWYELLKDAALGQGTKPGDNVVIIGGGNTAIDSARTSLRLGSRNVTILYRRAREQMPAFEEEVIGAEEEGIEMKFLCAPIRLLEENGKLTGIECVRMKLGESDKSGRPRPIPIKHSEFVVPCEAIIPTIGQKINTSLLAGNNTIQLTKWNLIQADSMTLATTQKKVFAGGDAVSGPASVIEAIAAGHKAARSIDNFINGIPLEEAEKAYQELFEESSQELSVEIPLPPKKSRVTYTRLSPSERKSSFIEVNQVFTEAEAVAEAQRCIRCGSCYECTSCISICEQKQIIIEPKGLTEEETLKTLLKLVRVPQEYHLHFRSKECIPAVYKGNPYRASVFTAAVYDYLCRGCGICEEICGYNAIRVIYKGDGIFTAIIDEDMCRGCGTCVSSCPTGALDQQFFSAKRISDLMRRSIRVNDGAVIFACYWSTLQSQTLSQNVIRMMCTGRIQSGDLLKAFKQGAKEVIILSCSDEMCHYGFGCHVTQYHLNRLIDVLELLGIDKERVHIIQSETQLNNTIKTKGR